IAVAPSYHRHNFIDQEYSKLNFELFHFFILEERGDFYFVLKKGEDSSEFKKCLIPYQSFEAQTFEDVSPPPDMLIVWLSVCTKEEQEGFWKVRRKILLCHPKMKEMIADKNSIQYGSGKTKLCAEIAFQRKLQKPILFLWLPTPSTWNVYRWNDDKKPVIGRLRIWTNGQTISHVGHVPKGFGKMKTREEWEQMPPSKKPHRMFMGFSSQSHTPVEIKRYLQTDHRTEERDFWDVLSGLTIDRWLAKVQS
ncbi:MAG TPA: recombinase RecB, partial [Cyanobacteria bacterium UBA8156]|nr:recombinase RecB [Cyanobacteria bacterium UBA8156]